MKFEKCKCVVLMGPTATGKTGMAVRLAQIADGEIISADSRQVYKDMDIGSGKDLDEYQEVKHHLIDILEAGAEFSVSEFQAEALKALKLIKDKSKIPIICGGTGYYIKALLEDYRFDSPGSDFEFAGQLESLSREELDRKLKKLDLPEKRDMPLDSKRRVARIIEKSMLPPRRFSPKPDFRENYVCRIYYTDVERSKLKANIAKRLRSRLNQGMLEEVGNLLKKGVGFQRLERYGLEYKWIARHLKGETDLQSMIDKLEVEIGRFAKRQVTFIRYMAKSGHRMRPVKNEDFFLKDAAEWIRSE